VTAADARKVLDEIAAAITEWRDPESGEPVAGDVRWAEDVYKGPLVADAPPLVVLPRAGWDPKGAVGRGVFNRSNLTGMHSYDDALLYWRGANRPARVTLEDVAASVLAHLGVDTNALDGGPVLA
jgi:predicted AlkP superfamily phosphohydrolase/phosphomutase